MIYHFFVLVPLFLFLDNNLQMLKIFLKNDFIKSLLPWNSLLKMMAICLTN